MSSAGVNDRNYTFQVRRTEKDGLAVLTLVCYGMTGGRYGTLWVRRIPTGLDVELADTLELHRLLLTALYGLDYDL